MSAPPTRRRSFLMDSERYRFPFHGLGSEFHLDNEAVVREGGMSLIVQRRDVLLRVKLQPNMHYILTPSTWKTDRRKKFSLSFFCSPSVAQKIEISEAVSGAVAV
ncbi:unnamed protein product [Amoebophrya sp. A120]|nr:unnamed protein product [Amoebophrya sp. A120]|eukprot:GSA120T00012489001.1